jgi:hypothetical protein
MKGTEKLKAAVQSKSLTNLTIALNEIGEELAYHLKPPYTEMKRYKASEGADLFAIEFSASLHLHYCNTVSTSDGLVFAIDFGGSALADSPTPPIHELFYAASVEQLKIYGYGTRWKGRSIPTPDKLASNLEVPSQTLNELDLDDFYVALGQAA